MKNSHKISAVVAAIGLMVPAGAVAKPDNPHKPDKPHKPAKEPKPPKVKTVSVSLKGTVTANDGTTVTVTVDKVSGQAKGCKGKSLAFTVKKVHSADNNADGAVTLADALVGHVVKIQGKVPKAPKGGKGTCTIPEGTALPAKQLHNVTTPKVDEEETETEETPAPAPTA